MILNNEMLDLPDKYITDPYVKYMNEEHPFTIGINLFIIGSDGDVFMPLYKINELIDILDDDQYIELLESATYVLVVNIYNSEDNPNASADMEDKFESLEIDYLAFTTNIINVILSKTLSVSDALGNFTNKLPKIDFDRILDNDYINQFLMKTDDMIYSLFDKINENSDRFYKEISLAYKTMGEILDVYELNHSKIRLLSNENDKPMYFQKGNIKCTYYFPNGL